MSSATCSQVSVEKSATQPDPRKPNTASPAAKPAAKRPSWKETFPFYSGLLEIV